MDNTFVANSSIVVNAPASKVWEALTEPELVKQYLFGTEVHTDWKEGSPITYTGEWQGKTYQDKGTILKVIPEKLLESTYWSSMSNLADKPENYKKVTYELHPEGGGTRLTIIQDNNSTGEEKAHSEGNWNTVLEKLKEVVERGQ